MSFQKDKKLEEWIEIKLTLLNNQKIMIEQAFINDFLEHLSFLGGITIVILLIVGFISLFI